jgi:hypothetical protein
LSILQEELAKNTDKKPRKMVSRVVHDK